VSGDANDDDKRVESDRERGGHAVRQTGLKGEHILLQPEAIDILRYLMQRYLRDIHVVALVFISTFIIH
jgi:hypothetical protein